MTGKKNGRPLKLEGKRTKFIKARVSEAEYALLRSLWVSLGLKESDFLRVKLLNSSSLSIKVNASEVMKSLDDIGAEIGRSGNNINQLARHANFLNKRGMLSNDVIEKFNELFSDYIFLFREMEKSTRALLRLLKG
ncbi:plasmid mobilization protein [Pedobacter endophyticus]|uniref:Plasmid mobilization relaxosome protein MobC n=1 Tax=Pedobacter endophyticus TaxID=2789740 RepID=A0A7S9L145_9SPHI|nr:plasmid mobilization relaxosome protein MobC [Pedobacter endophyticus]QPH40542.1 plasmid mobilization relaxosome protein MobC [Pedobacter endophyticus]